MDQPKPRVLVVDDEPTIRRVSERVLERAGLEVLSASDGDEAFELIVREPDLALILLDASMPRMSGERVLELMRERGLSTPVVVSSGFSDDELPSPEAFPNLRRTLSKPYQMAELLACVNEVLGAG